MTSTALRVNEPASTGDSGEELAAINAALARLLGANPVELVRGADRSLGDRLVVCGILGGKDVGKSTLINALACTQVSRDDEQVGPGTERPIAYIHRDAVNDFRGRFSGDDGLAARLTIVDHDAEAIRDVVLVDLPDFDSDLPQHFETVRAVAPLLDRIIWVTTPGKIVDRTWVSLLHKVVKDPRNVYCVLNKLDELLGDDAYQKGIPADFWRDQETWVEGTLQRVGFAAEQERRFLIAALLPDEPSFAAGVGRQWADPDWRDNASDRSAVEAVGRRAAGELRRLRNAVLTRVDPDEAAVIKQANRSVELRRNAAAIRAHYQLDEWRAALDAACDPAYHAALLDETFGDAYCRAAGERLERAGRGDAALADQLLATRVEPYALLRMIYWPLRWLVRAIGSRMLTDTRPAPTEDAGDALVVDGRPVSERVADLLGRFEADHARLIHRLGLASRLPPADRIAEGITERGRRLIQDLDAERAAALTVHPPRASGAIRVGLWMILVWFTLGQPVTEGMLRVVGAGGRPDLLGGTLQLVMALSAARLLSGLAVVAAIYLLILSAMYARCMRRVRRMRSEGAQMRAQRAGTAEEPAGAGGRDSAAPLPSAAERVYEVLVEEAVRPTVAAVAAVRAEFDVLLDRLARLGIEPQV